MRRSQGGLQEVSLGCREGRLPGEDKADYIGQRWDRRGPEVKPKEKGKLPRQFIPSPLHLCTHYSVRHLGTKTGSLETALGLHSLPFPSQDTVVSGCDAWSHCNYVGTMREASLEAELIH